MAWKLLSSIEKYTLIFEYVYTLANFVSTLTHRILNCSNLLRLGTAEDASLHNPFVALKVYTEVLHSRRISNFREAIPGLRECNLAILCARS